MVRIREYRTLKCEIGCGAFSGERVVTVEILGLDEPLAIFAGAGYVWSDKGEHKPSPLPGQTVPGFVAVRYWRLKSDPVPREGNWLVEFPDERCRVVDAATLCPIPAGDWSPYLL